MILQALCDYYDRKQDDLPPFGFEEKAIPFIIVIDGQGRFINLETNANQENGKTLYPPLRVPKASGRAGIKSYQTAYCLWDHYGYVIGQPKLAKPGATPTPKDIDTANKQHLSFKALVDKIYNELPDDEGVRAVKRFLDLETEIERLKTADNWLECLKIKGCNLTFRLSGVTELVCQSTQVIEWVKRQPPAEDNIKSGLCSITGEPGPVVRLHDAITGVAQKPAPLASINEAAYNSFGKDKGFNFPVGVEAAFKYATALNHLLRKSSPTKFRIADTSYVCWAQKQETGFLENALSFIFADTGDDPERGAETIKNLFSSIHNGAYQASEGQDQFYVLGLSPNAARIVVRFWKVGTVLEFSEKLAVWFQDIDITGADQFGFPPLKKLLRASALQYKDDNIAPNLPGDVIRAILSGSKLPDTFLQAIVRRIKAEQGAVTYTRASVLKACLNRKYRLSNPIKKELTVTLNKEEQRIGYNLGRLFAVLEKLQLDAQPGIKATIRDRYYSSASSAPKTVFGTLMRLSTHHLNKLKKNEWKIATEKKIGNIIASISDFPSHLNLENQGLFAIGYYHEKQAMYQKNKEQGDNNESE